MTELKKALDNLRDVSSQLGQLEQQPCLSIEQAKQLKAQLDQVNGMVESFKERVATDVNAPIKLK